MSLRIVFPGRDREDTFEHARNLVRHQQQWRWKNRPHEINPRGIAVHTAIYPRTCDECGGTYWSREEWASHIGCPGPPKPQKAGF